MEEQGQRKGISLCQGMVVGRVEALAMVLYQQQCITRGKDFTIHGFRFFVNRWTILAGDWIEKRC